MAELWELICHHTYRGIPGVVVDTSPHQASHGRAIGLDNSDFLADGGASGGRDLEAMRVCVCRKTALQVRVHAIFRRNGIA